MTPLFIGRFLNNKKGLHVVKNLGQERAVEVKFLNSLSFRLGGRHRKIRPLNFNDSEFLAITFRFC
jgi:hypothetical protein